MTQLKSKLACVVDTSVLRHWKGIRLNDLSLDGWLEREFTVHTSEAIIDEITNQERVWGSEAKRARKKARQWLWNLTYPAQLELALLSHFVDKTEINIDKNAGERRNFCATVDLVRKDECRHVIFLIDDERAVEGFLRNAFNTFRVACIWNSLDFVLYLYIRHKRSMSLPLAKNVVRDVISNFTKDAANISKLQWKLTDYHMRLETISFALDKIPV